MKRKFFGYLLFLMAFSGVLSSCIDEEFEELGDTGQTFVKTLEQPVMFFSPFDDVKKIDGFSLRRDANSNAALQQSATVRLVPDASLVPDGYELLPDDFYTLAANSGFEKTANGYNVKFNGGDFAKEFTINLDGSKWVDMSKKYALAFRIEDAGGLKIADGKSSAVMAVAIKNKYDGKYEMTGTMVDTFSPSLTGPYPLNVELHTLSENSVALFDTEIWGDYFHAIMSGTSWSGYGSFAPVFIMDDDGNVISVTNYYGQEAGGLKRSARLESSGVNKFTINADGSRTLEVTYVLVQGGVDRTTFTETFTYKGER